MASRAWPALVAAGFSPPAGSNTVVAGFSPPSETDLFQAALTDYPIAAIDETDPQAWRVYFHDAAERDRALAELQASFPDLALSPLDIEDEDWAARSQASLTRIQVGNVIVAPPWDAPLVITIQPSMGFGTGHHATTRQCLAALQAIALRDRTVIDVGTGSGVLAIAASRLGASEVTGIDDDGDAIQAAWENLALNPGAQVALIVGDVRGTELRRADVVLANLTGGLLVAAAERLLQLVAYEGCLILSGFQAHEADEVIAAFAGWRVERRADEDGWVALTLKPKTPVPNPKAH